MLSKLLILNLILFLGACSTAKDNFLEKVANKSVYNNSTLTDLLGTFSSDGEKIERTDPDGILISKYTFEEVIDANNGRYELIQDNQKFSYIIETFDGVSGTIRLSGGTTASGLWFINPSS